jgi:hypothetical protein
MRVRRKKAQDECFESWASWREACAQVHRAYRRWSQAENSERDRAFESYRTALDLEEQAASVHALSANRLGTWQQT